MNARENDAQDLQGADPGRAVENSEIAEKIRSVAGGLPPVQRMVFALRDLQDLPVAEVAHLLQISPGAVKANLCLARARIRRVLAQEEGMQP
jgi:RNA polymerase sigma-70 factor (ECF subfamily)